MRLRIERVGKTAGLLAAVGGLAIAGAGSAAAALVEQSGQASLSGGALAHPGVDASTGLDVLPFPGTPDAAPQTNVDFPAVSPGQIESVTVAGSRSGVHAGRLSAQPAGRGATFHPEQPFAPGEQVMVTATLSSAAAGAASGAPGTTRLRFSFGIARFASAGRGGKGPSALPALRAQPAAGRSRPKTHSFVSAPGLHPPIITMTHEAPHREQGDILLDAQLSGQSAVYILNRRGDLLWYQPTGSSDQAFGLREQTYQGKPVLTYWRGPLVCPPCGGRGQDLILNNAYQTIHTITPGAGYQTRGADQHEVTLTPQGTALIQLWVPVQANLTSVGGPANGTVIDWVIQEINVATGSVVWEWHALGHVPLTDSYWRYVPGQPFDYFHLNSIQQLSNGHILISSRHTWGVYAIDKKTGRIVWQVGGKHSSFRMGSGAQFEWQHDATLHRNGLLTLFDDNSAGVLGHSRGLELHLGMKRRRATLVRAFPHSPPVFSVGQGSMQLLSNGNAFVGWGTAPTFSQYNSRGKQLFSGSYPPPIQSYRAYRFPWIGAPTWQPAIAVRPSSSAGHDKVYASWNGATRVAQWRVLAGATASSLAVVKKAPWANFETRIETARAKYFEVQALDAHGHVLPHGTSAVVAGP